MYSRDRCRNVSFVRENGYNTHLPPLATSAIVIRLVCSDVVRVVRVRPRFRVSEKMPRNVRSWQSSTIIPHPPPLKTFNLPRPTPAFTVLRSAARPS